ncbi:DNA mismatch repair endonuclease MutL [Candidatus Dojkabacteria bacterium]|nr:DNA mismatch repair endonuclease MutL [Candidatus Dojkabacteria bacterium]
MAKIIRLPQHVINQIAAGEVIEGPASVVKELLENSIDAGATEIIISLKDGGKSEIKIEDNGVGFSKDDLPLAFEPHTTSKLQDISDLAKLETLGFRGEALASIGSVSKITVETKESETDNGTSITVEHGKISTPKVTNRKPGTTITITNLFEKIPARQKFLKSTQTEIRKISAEIIKRVLVNPTIRFKLIHNGKELFDFLPISVNTHDSKTFIHPSRIEDVLGKEETESLIPVYTKADSVTVGGMIGHPILAKTNQSHTYIFLNKRPIWDRGIIKSVYAGTNRFVANGSKIPFAIYLTIDPTQVDVNVHPQKLEVRFVNPYRVYSDIEHAVRSALETALKKRHYLLFI